MQCAVCIALCVWSAALAVQSAVCVVQNVRCIVEHAHHAGRRVCNEPSATSSARCPCMRAAVPFVPQKLAQIQRQNFHVQHKSSDSNAKKGAPPPPHHSTAKHEDGAQSEFRDFNLKKHVIPSGIFWPKQCDGTHIAKALQPQPGTVFLD